MRPLRFVPPSVEGICGERYRGSCPLPGAPRSPHDVHSQRAPLGMTRSEPAMKPFQWSRSLARPVQGEGPEMGRPAYFVRFGGCDFRCSWCDSMHAVDPAVVRATAEQSGASETRARPGASRMALTLVVLSGGNPALLDLGAARCTTPCGWRWRWPSRRRAAAGSRGSREVDRLVVSPKGPSSGMDTPEHRRRLTASLRSPSMKVHGLCSRR